MEKRKEGVKITCCYVLRELYKNNKDLSVIFLENRNTI